MADTITLAIDALTSAAFIEGGVTIERTEEARERTEQRKRELIEAIAASNHQAVEAQAPAAVAVPDERAEFERWARWCCYDITRDGGNAQYDSNTTEQVWIAWKHRASLATPAHPATEDSSAGDLAEPSPQELMALSNECMKLPGGMGMHYLNYAKAVLARWGAAPQAQPADALDAELLELVRAMVKFQKERGSVLQVHINNMADLLDERDAAMAAAQEGGNAAKEA